MWHVPDFPLSIRDVQNVLASDKDNENSYLKHEENVAALDEFA